MTKTKWVADPSHSEVGFKIRHLMITNVNGRIEEFSATIDAEEENSFRNAVITFEGEMSSVTTGAEQRDAHLRGADFFDVENYPLMKFVSTKVDAVGEDKYYVHGDLSIRNITKPVSFEAEFTGMAKDPWGNTKAGFELNGKINRKDFDLNWNAALETGGVLVGDEVKIYGEVQLVKQN